MLLRQPVIAADNEETYMSGVGMSWPVAGSRTTARYFHAHEVSSPTRRSTSGTCTNRKVREYVAAVVPSYRSTVLVQPSARIVPPAEPLAAPRLCDM
jgi:hypothetical protein